jgi:predicted enzyme related to lactoylglutathione lyase
VFFADSFAIAPAAALKIRQYSSRGRRRARSLSTKTTSLLAMRRRWPVSSEAIGGCWRVNRADSLAVSVTETFFGLEVEDMRRATAFYVDALGATVVFSSPGWSSLRIAEVRVGLALSSEHLASRVGLHFGVSDLATARADVERAGGCIVSSSVEVAPGVIIVRCDDTEGNTFTLTQGQHASHRDG